jgi:uncharacterized protein (TIGR02118 family)
MIKLSVLYPYSADSRFDHDYYRDKHMKLIKQRLGDACLYYAIDKGLAGGAPDSPPPFHAMCHIVLESAAALETAFNPHVAEFGADLPNYTDVVPTIQLSEIVVERG